MLFVVVDDDDTVGNFAAAAVSRSYRQSAFLNLSIYLLGLLARTSSIVYTAKLTANTDTMNFRREAKHCRGLM